VQGRDLLRHEADQKERQGIDQEHRTHIGEAPRGGVCVAVEGKPSEEKDAAQRQEEPHRREQRANLEDDDKEPHPVLKQPDMALAATLRGTDRDIADGKPRAEESHGDRSRVGETVRQQVEEPAEVRRPHRAEPE